MCDYDTFVLIVKSIFFFYGYIRVKSVPTKLWIEEKVKSTRIINIDRIIFLATVVNPFLFLV